MKSSSMRAVESHLVRLTRLGSVVFVLSLMFAMALSAQEPEKFCAREWPLDDNALRILEKAAAKVLDPSRTAPDRWPSRTIPFVVDERVKADTNLYAATRRAAGVINKYSNIKLAECPLDVAEDTDELKGYIYVSTSGAQCRNGCCALHVGYKPKLIWGFLKTLRSRDEIARGSIIGIGASACAPGKTEGGITHEFLHALGFNHAHQSPPSRSYIVKKVGEAYNCDMETDYHWMQQYDPASIMHYALTTSACRFELKKKGDANSADAIDDLNSSDAICGYNNAPGVSCFQKGTVFGNRNCLSFNDQAWIYAMYEDVDEYGFGKLEDLIKDGTCTVIK